jgi:hypothetical protein
VVVVLCEVADLPALWAARALERRGLEVEVVSAPVLSCALRWEHRVSRDGACASLQLADGRRLSSERPVGVLNRVTSVSPDRFVAVAGADRDYALQEMFALLLSVLHALPGPVVNRPTPHGLCGAWRHPSEWTALAAEVGLPGVLAHGMLTMGLAVQPVVDRFGIGAILDYQVRFTKPVPVPPEGSATLAVEARVARIDEAAGTARVDLSVKLGEDAVLGRAQVQVRLP